MRKKQTLSTENEAFKYRENSSYAPSWRQTNKAVENQRIRNHLLNCQKLLNLLRTHMQRNRMLTWRRFGLCGVLNDFGTKWQKQEYMIFSIFVKHIQQKSYLIPLNTISLFFYNEQCTCSKLCSCKLNLVSSILKSKEPPRVIRIYR